MSEQELKPCPCCENENDCDPQVEIFIEYINFCAEKVPLYYVECNSCQLRTDSNQLKQESIDNWNTRPIEDELRAEIERLKGKMKNMAQRDIFERKTLKSILGDCPKCGDCFIQVGDNFKCFSCGSLLKYKDGIKVFHGFEELERDIDELRHTNNLMNSREECAYHAGEDLD